MEKILSVIIPVYNNASGVEECVKSIDFKEKEAVEVIVVDDGSTDGTKEVLKNLAGSRRGIICISKEHAGVVAARMLGLSVSKGEYIWFVDSDDALCEGAVDAVLNDICQNGRPDMIVFNHFSKEDGKIQNAPQQLANGNYNRQQIEEEIFPYIFHDFRQSHFRQPILDGFLWNKVWKKDLISSALCRNKRIRLFEDAISVFMAVAFTKSLYKSGDFRYIYKKGTSATSSYRADYFENTALCSRLLNREMKKLPSKLRKNGKRGANAFITERLIVSIVRELRYRKDYAAIYRFVAGELKKYRIQKKLKFDGLPLVIKLYLFLLKAHLYVPALIIAKGMV